MGDISTKLIEQIIKNSVNTENISNQETESLIALCLMNFGSVGTENPRLLCSNLSDTLLDHIISHLNEIKENNQVFKSIIQILIIEWCYRNDYLEEDWKWEWTEPTVGQLHYRSKIPLNCIPLPIHQKT